MDSMLDFFINQTEGMKPIEIVASIIAISSLIFSLVYWLIGKARKSLDSWQAAQDSFDAELNEYRKAGSTVSARSDLGFFIMIVVNSLRNEATQHYRTAMFFSSIGVLFVLLDFIRLASDLPSKSAKDVFIMPVILWVVAFINYLLYAKSQSKAKKHEDKFKDVWSEAVLKRSK